MKKMKTFVALALLASLSFGSVLANPMPDPPVGRAKTTEPTSEAAAVAALRTAVDYHKGNVARLWEQYEVAKARIRNSSGNHASIEADKAFFIGLYQEDIKNGVRVAEAERAIAELEIRYAKEHAKRTAYEAEQFAQLRTHLKTALQKEVKAFTKTKRRYAKATETEIVLLIDEMDRYFADAVQRVDNPADAQ